FRQHMLDLAIALPYLGEHCPLARCMLVKRYAVQPFELMGRFRVCRSVWAEYERNWEDGLSSVAGQSIIVGLRKWEDFPPGLLFTPSTKAETGHDQNITAAKYFAETGEVGRRTEASFRAALTAIRRRFNAVELEVCDGKGEYDLSGDVMVDAGFGLDEIRACF